MTSFSRLFRDRAGDDVCPEHGDLRGQTRCRFCGFDPLLPSSGNTARLPRTLSPLGAGALSIRNLGDDAGKQLADVSERHEKFLPNADLPRDSILMAHLERQPG